MVNALSRKKLGLFSLMLISILPLLPDAGMAGPGNPDKAYVMAVLDFENDTGSASNDSLVKAMTDTMTTSLVKSGLTQVLERSKIRKILEEQQLILSGLIDTGKVAYVGKMLAADHIVIGALSRVGEEWITNIRLLDVKTGRILMAEMFTEKEQVKILPKTKEFAELFLETIRRGQKENYLMTFLISPRGGGQRKITSDEEKKLVRVLRKKIEGYGGSARRISLDRQKLEAEIAEVSEPLELARILMSNDVLEFRLVNEEFDPSSQAPPPGCELLAEKNKGREWLIAVRKEAVLTGENIENASVSISDVNEPSIMIQFDQKGTARFAQITKENIRKKLAIILNGEVLMAPVIQTEISDGKAQITGQFTLDEAFHLSLNLKSGNLPVSLSLSGLEKIRNRDAK